MRPIRHLLALTILAPAALVVTAIDVARTFLDLARADRRGSW